MRTGGWCRFCQRMRSVHCRSTREMEDMKDEFCREALLRLGGEYTVNQRAADEQGKGDCGK